MERRTDFLWRFPVYVLVGEQNVDPETGVIKLDDRLRFVTPEIGPNLENRIAVFTDRDLAERFLLAMKGSQEVRLGSFPTPSSFGDFLARAQSTYQRLLVDATYGVPPYRSFLIQEVLPQLIDPQGR